MVCFLMVIVVLVMIVGAYGVFYGDYGCFVGLCPLSFWFRNTDCGFIRVFRLLSTYLHFMRKFHVLCNDIGNMIIVWIAVVFR